MRWQLSRDEHLFLKVLRWSDPTFSTFFSFWGRTRLTHYSAGNFAVLGVLCARLNHQFRPLNVLGKRKLDQLHADVYGTSVA